MTSSIVNRFTSSQRLAWATVLIVPHLPVTAPVHVPDAGGQPHQRLGTAGRLRAAPAELEQREQYSTDARWARIWPSGGDHP